jgi:hypothetical protein
MTATASTFRQYHALDAGPDGYCAEWHKTLKHLVRAQAGNRCVRCKHPYRCGEKQTAKGEWTPCDMECEHSGPARLLYSDLDGNPVDVLYELGRHGPALAISSGKTVLAQWRILTVHHLDGDKLNCRWWNLAALCQRCHLTIQGRVKMARPWMLEHSTWFKPYAAGYYASLRGEELTREQVTDRLEELLAIGQGRTPANV